MSDKNNAKVSEKLSRAKPWMIVSEHNHPYIWAIGEDEHAAWNKRFHGTEPTSQQVHELMEKGERAVRIVVSLPSDDRALTAEAEVATLKERLRLSEISTHAEGCWSWGHRHYECAVAEVERLKAEVARFTRVDVCEIDMTDWDGDKRSGMIEEDYE